MAGTINTDRVVTLNMGVGRDSIAMLCLLAEGNLQAVVDGTMHTFRPADINAVVFSDTGAEWDHTYQLIPTVRAMCEELGVPFVVLAKPSDEDAMAWVAAKRNDPTAKQQWQERWKPEEISCDGFGCLEAKAAAGGHHKRPAFFTDMERLGQIASRGGSCTCNHKLSAIRHFIADLARQLFGVKDNSAWARDVAKGLRPQHLSLVGFAADEASRANKHKGTTFHGTVLPLVDMGIAKADEAPILARHGLGHVRKSGCVACPEQPMMCFWALKMLRPDLFERTVAMEQAALRKNGKMYISSTKGIRRAVEDWAAAHAGNTTPGACIDKRYDSILARELDTIEEADALRSTRSAARRAAAEARQAAKAATQEEATVEATEPSTGDLAATTGDTLELRGGRYTTTATVEDGTVVGGRVYSQKLDGTCRTLRARSWSMVCGRLSVEHTGKGLPAVALDELEAAAASLAGC